MTTAAGNDYEALEGGWSWFGDVVGQALEHGEWLAAHCPRPELRLIAGAGHITVLDSAPAVLTGCAPGSPSPVFRRPGGREAGSG